MAADAGVARSVGARVHGLGNRCAGDAAVTLQRPNQRELDGLDHRLPNPFAGTGFGAVSKQKTGLEDVEPIKAEQGQIAFRFAFHAEVEVAGTGRGRDGGDGAGKCLAPLERAQLAKANT